MPSKASAALPPARRPQKAGLAAPWPAPSLARLPVRRSADTKAPRWVPVRDSWLADWRAREPRKPRATTCNIAMTSATYNACTRKVTGSPFPAVSMNNHGQTGIHLRPRRRESRSRLLAIPLHLHRASLRLERVFFANELSSPLFHHHACPTRGQQNWWCSWCGRAPPLGARFLSHDFRAGAARTTDLSGDRHLRTARHLCMAAARKKVRAESRPLPGAQPNANFRAPCGWGSPASVNLSAG